MFRAHLLYKVCVNQISYYFVHKVFVKRSPKFLLHALIFRLLLLWNIQREHCKVLATLKYVSTIKYFMRVNFISQGRRGSGAQGCDCNAIVVGSIPTRWN